MNTNKREESLTLDILEAIEQRDDITQRHLADRLGVALGLANSYLKRCVKKGLVKIHQAPANRYLYYLTPKGFTEKSRLTTQYLSISFDFYRTAGSSMTHIYKQCEKEGIRQILFCGISELAEIALLRSQEHDIEIVGTYDPNSARDKFLHFPVWRQLKEIEQYDACLLTALNDTMKIYESLVQEFGQEKILIPSILGITKKQ